MTPTIRWGGPIPLAIIAASVVTCLILTLAFVAIGVWQTDIFGQGLWSVVLRDQALTLLAVAALGTAMCIWVVPMPGLRGWPSLVAMATFWTCATCGVGATLAVLSIAAVCLVAGHATLRLGGVSEPVDPVLGMVSGLGVVTLLLVAAGLAHVQMVFVFWLCLLAATAAIALSASLRASIRGSFADLMAPSAAWTVPRAMIAWLIMFAWFFYAANAALPERFWDALAMHLLIPSQIATFGHWAYDPGLFAFALFPLAGDYLFAFAMSLGGESAAKVTNMFLLAGILLSLHRLVLTFSSAIWAELGILLLLSMPVALLSSSTVMVENLISLFAIGAIQAVFLVKSKQPRQAVLAICIFVSALASVKLHGVVIAVPIFVITIVLLQYRRLTAMDSVAIGTFSLFFGFLGFAQYLYAYYRTSNPFFPLMNNVFHSPLWPSVPFEDLRWQGHLTWNLVYQMTFYSSRFMECFDGAMGFTILGLLLPGVVATILKPRFTPVIALVVAGLYFVVIAVQIQYIRYFYPVMPLLVIVCVYGMQAIPGRAVRAFAGASGMVLAIMGLLALPSGAWTLRAADLSAVYKGSVRHAMLTQQVPTRLAVGVINAFGLTNPRVVFGGEPYGGLLQGTPIYTNWYNRDLGSRLTAAADTEAVRLVLQAERADFIVASPASVDQTEAKIVAYADRWGDRVSLIGGVALWRIDPR